MFKLINIMLTLPVGTATVERSFSQMKMIKTRLRNHLNDTNLKRLMRIAIEGPEMKLVDFNEVHHCADFSIITQILGGGGNWTLGEGGGEIPVPPPPPPSV